MNANYPEDDLLPLSALATLVYCVRRAALQNLEGIWEDNVLTMEGTLAHEAAHDQDFIEKRAGVRIARGLALRSLRLGLSGKADVVEFHPWAEPDAGPPGIRLPHARGLWRPFPVEYKRGRRRHEKGYEVQVCAQALCLEEMLSVEIPRGALYYAATHRRLEVEFTPELRGETEAAAARLHDLVRTGTTPKAETGPKCQHCSLKNVCLPEITGGRRTVQEFIEAELARVRR